MHASKPPEPVPVSPTDLRPLNSSILFIYEGSEEAQPSDLGIDLPTFWDETAKLNVKMIGDS
jgi:hypothetical protein